MFSASSSEGEAVKVQVREQLKSNKDSRRRAVFYFFLELKVFERAQDTYL
jgi:hypothetical protein